MPIPPVHLARRRGQHQLLRASTAQVNNRRDMARYSVVFRAARRQSRDMGTTIKDIEFEENREKGGVVVQVWIFTFHGFPWPRWAALAAHPETGGRCTDVEWWVSLIMDIKELSQSNKYRALVPRANPTFPSHPLPSAPAQPPPINSLPPFIHHRHLLRAQPQSRDTHTSTNLGTYPSPFMSLRMSDGVF